jgi:RNA polymerase sigma-70 factor (ECF subfamily)
VAEERSGPALGARAVRDGAHENHSAHLVAPEPSGGSVADRFGAEVLSHSRWLAQLAFGICGDGNRSEDAVADAYARVWPKYRRGRIDNIVPYLVRAMVAYLREHAKREPDHTAAAQSYTDPVWPALLGLPIDERAALVLHYVEGLPYEDTATLLGENRETVRARADTGLAQLLDAVGMQA